MSATTTTTTTSTTKNDAKHLERAIENIREVKDNVLSDAFRDAKHLLDHAIAIILNDVMIRDEGQDQVRILLGEFQKALLDEPYWLEYRTFESKFRRFSKKFHDAGARDIAAILTTLANNCSTLSDLGADNATEVRQRVTQLRATLYLRLQMIAHQQYEFSLVLPAI
jgi:hypothetical protein